MFGRQRIQLKNDEQIVKMRAAGLVTAAALDAVRSAIAVGVSTAELDQVAAAVIEEHEATSNFLDYYGYPASICVSINDVVVHGIPGDQIIQPGDVVSVDGGAIVEGWHGDSAFTVVVDPVDSADAALVRTTEDALWAGIAAVAKRGYLNDIGRVVEATVTAANECDNTQYGVLRDYVGHGIGTAMHQPPEVLNYAVKERGPALKSGICLAIEPMVTMHGIETEVLEDEWTVRTIDGARAAHWEHTVALHDKGIWVLTAPDGGAERLAALGVEVAPLQ